MLTLFHQTLNRACLIALLAGGLSTLGATSAFAASWSIKDLGTLPGGTFTVGTGLNDSGQVVGSGDLVPQFNEQNERIDKPFAFISGANGGALTLMDTGPADGFLSNFEPAAVNNAGQAVGTAMQGSSFELAFVTGPGGTPLNYVTGDFDSSGLANGVDINNNGEILYQSFQGLDTPRLVEPDGKIIDITGENQNGFAKDINDSGQVALNLLDTEHDGLNGYIWSQAGGFRPVRTDGIPSNVFAINNAGQVLARSSIANGGTFILEPDNKLHFLSLPAGSSISDDNVTPRINNAGQVIGELQLATGGRFAFVTAVHGSTLINLETVPAILQAGLSHLQVSAINNLGQIAGTGTIDGAQHAFLLSPVPEPETYALMLAGLGLLGGMQARRRKNLRTS